MYKSLLLQVNVAGVCCACCSPLDHIQLCSQLLVRNSKACAPFRPSSEACCLSFTRFEVKSELQRENPWARGGNIKPLWVGRQQGGDTWAATGLMKPGETAQEMQDLSGVQVLLLSFSLSHLSKIRNVSQGWQWCGKFTSCRKGKKERGAKEQVTRRELVMVYHQRTPCQRRRNTKNDLVRKALSGGAFTGGKVCLELLVPSCGMVTHCCPSIRGCRDLQRPRNEGTAEQMQSAETCGGVGKSPSEGNQGDAKLK